MNLNDMAVAVSKVEGKSEEVNIAQIKEIIATIPVIYNDYVTQGETEMIPFYIARFIKKVTRDKFFVEVKVDDLGFQLILSNKFENYNLKEK